MIVSWFIVELSLSYVIEMGGLAGRMLHLEVYVKP